MAKQQKQQHDAHQDDEQARQANGGGAHRQRAISETELRRGANAENPLGVEEDTLANEENILAAHGAGQGIVVPQGMIRGESVEGPQDTLSGAGFMGGTDAPLAGGEE